MTTTCAICGREMEEYADDRYGISDFSLEQTVYAGSVFACPEHGTIEQQWNDADTCDHSNVKFVSSNDAYWPGSNSYFECTDCGATTTEWSDWEEMEDGFVERGREPLW